MLIIILAYTSTWYMVYRQSKRYFDFAEQQYEEENYILALKGQNKIELYPGDDYFGGYQQVIEGWRFSLFTYKPAFYYKSLERSKDILQKASTNELEYFIKYYVEVDTKYIPEAAGCLLRRYQNVGYKEGEIRMNEFLAEAFPLYSKDNDCHLYRSSR
ncbi:hypothetical protein BHS62_25630 [Salmonella enterica]|nr:hypothetical protein [Salmonella enterica]EAX6581921.1 hypothetical protein [Salmonella enterica]